MECSVCFEKNTRTRFFVECQVCGDYSVCVGCARIYLLSEEASSVVIKGCMVCKNKWDHEFIKYIFGPETFQKYKDIEKEFLFEREKKLMKYTQPLVEHAILVDELTMENDKLFDVYHTLQNAADETMETIHNNQDRIRETPRTKGKYVMLCQTEGCKGFIRDDDWTCGICNIKICNQCLSIEETVLTTSTSGNGYRITQRHICKKENLSAAKMILTGTKACPSCATRITKLEGCSQMFCTNCHTGFDWETLKISKGNIHNPHYYELVAQGKIRAGGDRVMGDIPCGGIPALGQIGVYNYFNTVTMRSYKSYIDFMAMDRRANEIQEYYTNIARLKPLEELFTDLRIKYMMNKLSDDEYKTEIYYTESYINRCIKEHEILTTFLATVSERYRFLREENNRLPSKRNGKSIGIAERRKSYLKIFDPLVKELEQIFEIIADELVRNDIGVLTYKDVNTFYRGHRSQELKQHDLQQNEHRWRYNYSDSDDE